MGFREIEMDMLSHRSGTLIAALICCAVNAFAAQAYYSPISINSGQVPSTQTDFPVLVSQTDNRFKTTGNGGHVANSNGYDIRPYSDTALTTALSYELERYNASTGEVIMWVKVGSLSSSTTPIYLGYGDTGLTTDGSSGANTFSNSFLAVWHLKDGTTLSGTDSIGSYNLTLSNTPTAAAGKIDGAAGLASASSQYLSNTGAPVATALTLSAWVKGTTFGTDYNPVITSGSGGVDDFGIFVKSNGKLYCIVKATSARSYDGTGSNTLSTGTWYYLTASYDSSAGLIGKVNASSDGTQTANGSASYSSHKIAIGDQASTDTRYFNGVIDEVRVASVARSADWITTEYNNQSAPGTFESLDTEVAVTASQRGWFMFLKK